MKKNVLNYFALFIVFVFTLSIQAKAQILFEFNTEIKKNEISFTTTTSYDIYAKLPNGKTVHIFRDANERLSRIEVVGIPGSLKLDFILERGFFFHFYWYYLPNFGEALFLDSFFPRSQGESSSILNTSVISFYDDGSLKKSFSFNSMYGGSHVLNINSNGEVIVSIFDNPLAGSEWDDCFYINQFRLKDDFTLERIYDDNVCCYQAWYGNLKESERCSEIYDKSYNKLTTPYVADPIIYRNAGVWGDPDDY